MRANTIGGFTMRTPLLRLRDLVSTETALLEAYRIPVVREALYLASPDLYSMLIELEKDAVKDNIRKEKALISLYKYYTRMCTRCTPFGLFAGITAGHLGEETEIQMEEYREIKIRLDMDYLCNLYFALNKNRSLYPYLTFCPNQSLYRIRSQWRYVEYQPGENGDRTHNLVSISDNDILSELIDRARQGMNYIQMKELIAAYEVEESEAAAYLDDLIQSQVLLSNLYPSVTGTFYQDRLFAFLDQLPIDTYRGLHQDLKQILREEIGIIHKYTRIEELLSRLDVKINFNHLLQVDLIKPAKKCVLRSDHRERIAEATNVLIRLLLPGQHTSLLDRFRIAYQERYEDMLMPLLQVMDTDIGLGYKDVVTNGRSKSQGNRETEKEITAIKIRLYSKALKGDLRSVELLEEDLSRLQNLVKYDLPSSYSFFGSLIYDKQGQQQIRYKLAGAASALNLLGRFGEMDAEIDSLCAAISKADDAAYPGAVLAEVAHLPGGRLGNVVARPAMRHYEIPYLSQSGLPAERQIPPDDLYVGVEGQRVVLFSRKLNREVIPRMANAHNYSLNGLPVYHFLGDLQTQQLTAGIFWSWDALYDQEFLPRVTFKNVILAPARWNIETASFRYIDFDANPDRFAELIRRAGLPDQLLLPQGDFELYMDLTTRLGALTFLKECRKHDRIVIEEFLYGEGDGPDGYAMEIVVPLFHQPRQRASIRNFRLPTLEEEILTPFSDWVYFKLYTGKEYAEKFLLETVPGLVKDLKERGVISKWFFIRYADPKSHLRLRFLLTSQPMRSHLLDIVQSWLASLLADQVIWDLQICTYMREADRYGKDTMETCETWFYHNSELVLRLLPYLRGRDAKQQLLIAIYTTDLLLSQFFHGLREKAAFVQLESELFNKEFKLADNKGLRQQLKDGFRQIHGLLKSMHAPGGGPADLPIAELHLVSHHELEESEKATAEFRRVYPAFDSGYKALAGSCIHMYINRLFREEQRFKELTIYYYLSKFYASEAVISARVQA